MKIRLEVKVYLKVVAKLKVELELEQNFNLKQQVGGGGGTSSETSVGGAGSSSVSSSAAAQPQTNKFRHGLLQLMIHTIDPLHDDARLRTPLSGHFGGVYQTPGIDGGECHYKSMAAPMNEVYCYSRPTRGKIPPDWMINGPGFLSTQPFEIQAPEMYTADQTDLTGRRSQTQEELGISAFIQKCHQHHCITSGKVDEKATQLHAIASLKVLLDATAPHRGSATASSANYLKETTLVTRQAEPNGIAIQSSSAKLTLIEMVYHHFLREHRVDSRVLLSDGLVGQRYRGYDWNPSRDEDDVHRTLSLPLSPTPIALLRLSRPFMSCPFSNPPLRTYEMSRVALQCLCIYRWQLRPRRPTIAWQGGINQSRLAEREIVPDAINLIYIFEGLVKQKKTNIYYESPSVPTLLTCSVIWWRNTRISSIGWARKMQNVHRNACGTAPSARRNVILNEIIYAKQYAPLNEYD
ncbi:unnamed protein product [Nesidiocoris tenuis]|uniref:Uncharacterized protein n=1 Tax=Nesidiocoris tenuis TaxID=355587 RepID=A0A6H5H3E9_9HEMI|nr:unnamed protein product [Nesidiocoris tenuis]